MSLQVALQGSRITPSHGCALIPADGLIYEVESVYVSQQRHRGCVLGVPVDFRGHAERSRGSWSCAKVDVVRFHECPRVTSGKHPLDMTSCVPMKHRLYHQDDLEWHATYRTAGLRVAGFGMIGTTFEFLTNKQNSGVLSISLLMTLIVIGFMVLTETNSWTCFLHAGFFVALALLQATNPAVPSGSQHSGSTCTVPGTVLTGVALYVAFSPFASFTSSPPSLLITGVAVFSWVVLLTNDWTNSVRVSKLVQLVFVLCVTYLAVCVAGPDRLRLSQGETSLGVAIGGLMTARAEMLPLIDPYVGLSLFAYSQGWHGTQAILVVMPCLLVLAC
eukprot:4140657-Amphidinium_carterae.1